MNESTIDILLVIIDVVIIALTGVLAGWVWGYRAGYSKAVKDANVFVPLISLCSQCRATMPDHYHGCPIAAEWHLVTIAKPGG